MMDLESVDLLMVECMRANDVLGTEEFLSRSAEPRVGSERPVFGHPGGDRALRDVAVESLAQDSLHFSHRVAQVES